jgi:hypothetical protein
MAEKDLNTTPEKRLSAADERLMKLNVLTLRLKKSQNN